MNIEECIKRIANIESCVLKKSTGLPDIPIDLKMPADLRKFYELSGGAILFQDSLYSIEIVTPQDLVRGNPLILMQSFEENISHDWFIAAKSEPQYITIDLNIRRLERCYDGFWDRHSVRGQCPIIARSFTELIEHLLTAEGKYLFWLAKDFVPLGDAYDDIPE